MPLQCKQFTMDAYEVLLKYMDANLKLKISHHMDFYSSFEKKIPLHIKRLEITSGSWKINDLDYQFSRCRQYKYARIPRPQTDVTDPLKPEEIEKAQSAKERLEQIITLQESYKNSNASSWRRKFQDLEEEARDLRKIVHQFYHRKMTSDPVFIDFFLLKIGENFEEKVQEIDENQSVKVYEDFAKEIFNGRSLIIVDSLVITSNLILLMFRGAPALKLRVKNLNFDGLIKEKIELDLIKKRFTEDSFPLDSVRIVLDNYGSNQLIVTAKKLIISSGDLQHFEGKNFENDHVHFEKLVGMHEFEFRSYLRHRIQNQGKRDGRVSFETGKKGALDGFFYHGQYEGKQQMIAKFEKNIFPIKLTRPYEDITNLDILIKRLPTANILEPFLYIVDVKILG